MKKNAILIIILVAIAIGIYFMNMKAVFPGTSSGQSQWTLCTPSSTEMTCNIMQGSYSPQNKIIDGLSWQYASCFWTGCSNPNVAKTLVSPPNKCTFTGTVYGICGAGVPQELFNGDREGIPTGDSCMFSNPIPASCLDISRIDITGKVKFYTTSECPSGTIKCPDGLCKVTCSVTPTGECMIASDCSIKAHAECEGYWSCESNICIWSCQNNPPVTPVCENQICETNEIISCPTDCPGPNPRCEDYGKYSNSTTTMECTQITVGTLTCYECKAEDEFPWGIWLVVGIIIGAAILLFKRI